MIPSQFKGLFPFEVLWKLRRESGPRTKRLAGPAANRTYVPSTFLTLHVVVLFAARTVWACREERNDNQALKIWTEIKQHFGSICPLLVALFTHRHGTVHFWRIYIGPGSLWRISMLIVYTSFIWIAYQIFFVWKKKALTFTNLWLHLIQKPVTRNLPVICDFLRILHPTGRSRTFTNRFQNNYMCFWKVKFGWEDVLSILQVEGCSAWWPFQRVIDEDSLKTNYSIIFKINFVSAVS